MITPTTVTVVALFVVALGGSARIALETSEAAVGTAVGGRAGAFAAALVGMGIPCQHYAKKRRRETPAVRREPIQHVPKDRCDTRRYRFRTGWEPRTRALAR
jgi:hypothetical protein